MVVIKFTLNYENLHEKLWLFRQNFNIIDGRKIFIKLSMIKLYHPSAKELGNAMWWNHVLRQKIQITAFSGHVSHRAADMGTGRTKDKRIARRGKQTVQATPGQMERALKRQQNPGVEGKRPGKDNRQQNTKRRQKPRRPEWGPARGGVGEPPHPLAKKSPHLVQNTDNRKPPKRGDWIVTERETSSRLPDQKKEKAREESSFATQVGMWALGLAIPRREDRTSSTERWPSQREDWSSEREDDKFSRRSAWMWGSTREVEKRPRFRLRQKVQWRWLTLLYPLGMRADSGSLSCMGIDSSQLR